MNFDVAVSGRPWKIAIEPADQTGHYTVIVKGRKRQVDVSWIDEDTLSLIEGSASREVRFHRRAEALEVAFQGRIFDTVVSKTGRAALAEKRPSADSGPQMIKTPMPGRIVRVLVAAGDRVIARQPVVIVEAMKMENELRSPKDGTVKEVLVAAGTAVEAGTVLLTID